MGGKSSHVRDRGGKRSTGVYYTPPYLARFLCRDSLARLISGRFALPFEDAEKFIETEDCLEVPASIRSRLAVIDAMFRGITIIDPAVGNGVMLATMIGELVKARVKISKFAGRESLAADFYRAAITSSLYGIDVNAEAIESARKAIFDLNGITSIVEEGDVKDALASHLVTGNALTEMEKFTRFGPFDIVISNPPYLSYYGNAPARMIASEKISLRQNFELFGQDNQRINTMNLFLELGIKLLKENGVLSYVVNKTLCVLPSYRKTRAYILSRCMINRLVIDLDPFDAIVDCAVLCVSKKKPPSDYLLSWCSLKGIPTSSASLASSIPCRQVQISVYQFARNKELEFTYSFHGAILEKMERAGHKLCDILLINRGINIGGCSEHFLSKTARDERYEKIILDARHVGRYRAWWDESQGYFVFDQEKERMLRAGGKTLVLGDPRRYEGSKLFIPEASKGIQAAYINTRLYSAYGILVGTSKHGENELKIACAMLNSRAISFYAIEREILRKGKKATPHAGVKGLAELPVPTFSSTARAMLIELVDEILEQLGAGRVANVSNKFQPEIKHLMAEIDRIVYDAFNLDANEILSINDAVDALFK
nr:TaqI-like C-terminal specificity domain-containing protein [Candidatus Sigynarchaeota archaeon]